MPARTIVNWDRTLRWTPTVVEEPQSEEDVVRAVRRARDAGERIKAVGAALSWSEAAAVPARAIRFDRMAEVLEVNREQKTVRMQPGAKLARVNQILAEHGLAFDNFGSITMQTAGGYTGTGSHGTGAKTPVLSAALRSMRLVDGTGAVRELSPEHEPELFRAARVHLGCLGAVTELTFHCVDAFDLEERLELIPFDRVLADLDALADGNDYLKLWWLPYCKKMQVYRFNRTVAKRTGFTLGGAFDSSGGSGLAFSGLMALSRAVPAIVPRMHELVQSLAFRPHTRVDRSDLIIKYAGTIPRHQETEYAVPRAHAAAAIEETRRAIEAARYRVNFPLEVRFVAADDIPLSPCNGRASCFIGAYIGSLAWAPRYFADFEGLIARFQGRPHWGKTFHCSAAELRALYPGYDGFAAWRRACDPQGLFRNAFVDQVFGLEG